jgi:hypothetical protein
VTAKIPAFLALPGPGEEAFIIRVQHVKELPKDCNGEWDSCTRTARIPKVAGRKRRLLIFDHEMAHALADYRLWLLQELGLKELE